MKMSKNHYQQKLDVEGNKEHSAFCLGDGRYKREWDYSIYWLAEKS